MILHIAELFETILLPQRPGQYQDYQRLKDKKGLEDQLETGLRKFLFIKGR